MKELAIITVVVYVLWFDIYGIVKGGIKDGSGPGMILAGIVLALNTTAALLWAGHLLFGALP